LTPLLAQSLVVFGHWVESITCTWKSNFGVMSLYVPC
jgi:hypothetical protein